MTMWPQSSLKVMFNSLILQSIEFWSPKFRTCPEVLHHSNHSVSWSRMKIFGIFSHEAVQIARSESWNRAGCL